MTAAVSDPEASEGGSSLIGKKSHYRGIESIFLAKRKELWLCANETFRMRNGLARNFCYLRMRDLGCAVDSQGVVVRLKWAVLHQVLPETYNNAQQLAMCVLLTLI